VQTGPNMVPLARAVMEALRDLPILAALTFPTNISSHVRPPFTHTYTHTHTSSLPPPCTRLDNAKQASKMRADFESQARRIQAKYEAQLRELHAAAEQAYAAGAPQAASPRGAICGRRCWPPAWRKWPCW
jgi:hypothetical protein